MLGTQLLLQAKHLRKGDILVTYNCPTVSPPLALTPDLPEVQRNLDTSYVWISQRADFFALLKSASVIQVFDSLFGMADACFSCIRRAFNSESTVMSGGNNSFPDFFILSCN